MSPQPWICHRQTEGQCSAPVNVGANIWTSYDLGQTVHKSKEGDQSQRRWVKLKKDKPY